MPAQNPRITAVVDHELAAWLKRRSEAEGRSISMVVRDILQEFYEDQEERYWAKEGEKRLETFREDESLSHDEVWS